MNKEKETQNKNSTLNKVLTWIIAVVSLALAFTGGYFSNYIIRGKNVGVASDIVSLMDKVGFIYDPVTGEEREITGEEIGDALVNAFLDDYSAYYTKEEYEGKVSQGAGNYWGIGVEFYYSDTQVDVVIGNSPADHAGMLAGDIIVSGQSVENTEKVYFNTASEIILFLIDCPIGKDITLDIVRNGQEMQLVVATRPYIASYVTYYDSDIKYSFKGQGVNKPIGTETENTECEIIDSDVALIRLDAFEGDASEQMKDALTYMKSRGRSKLILDLRNNGGGFMDTASEIGSYFIDNGGKRKSVFAYAMGKTGTETFTTPKNNCFTNLEKMVVLANENTASASECLIGALVHYKEVLKDITDIVLEENDKGVAKTYGKGIMQTTYKLVSGGALKLTTAKIYWPDKKTSIHSVGVLDGTPAKKTEVISVALDKLR